MRHGNASLINETRKESNVTTSVSQFDESGVFSGFKDQR